MTDEEITKLDADEREKVFLDMPEPDRWRVMFTMLAYLRSEIPKIKREQIEFRQELLRRAKSREEREEKQKSTNEKIEAFFSKRFDFWIWFRDKVLPQIIALVTLAILYLTFGNGKP